VTASWRRVNQQFKILFLFWFGLQSLPSISAFTQPRATPELDAVSFLSFGLLAVHYWNDD